MTGNHKLPHQNLVQTVRGELYVTFYKRLTSALLSLHSTIQNYLIWRLIIDRVSSLSRRFKDARANYRKVFPLFLKRL